MSSNREAYHSVLKELKDRIGQYTNTRLGGPGASHHEPDGDEDAKGKEPNEEGYELESAVECPLCGGKHGKEEECE